MRSIKCVLGMVMAGLLAVQPALADVVVGTSQPLTGPGSGAGIPMNNSFKLWPSRIAGETVRLIVLDDATDPTKGVANLYRLVTQDKVDIVINSAATPVAAAMSQMAREQGTVQIAAAPVNMPPGQDAWVFRLPQSTDVMAHAMVKHMRSAGIKTVGFLGYSDTYGELWLKAFSAEGEKAGIRIVSIERFARTDTSVTPQALKLAAVNPDAMLIVASGSGAAMPHMAMVERGFKGRIYQTHAAATMDLIRIGGKSVEGAYVVSGPAMVGAQLPGNHPSKKAAMDFLAGYEAAYGTSSANQFAAHAYDARLVLEKAIPIARKKGQPGTPEFRAALREALETMGSTPLAHGVMNWTAQDHWGYTDDTGVMLKVVGGQFVVEK